MFMNFQQIVFLWLISLLVSNVTFAQSPNKIIWSSDNDLLPQNSVKSIVPDQYGYLWMTTENGLVRFDGKNYKIFNSQNLNLKSNRMLYIQGNIASDSLFVASDYNQDLILVNKRTAVKINPNKTKNTHLYLNEENDIYNSSGTTPYPLDLINWSYRILLPSNHYYIVTKNTVKYYSPKKKLLNEVSFEKANTKLFITIGDKLFYIKNEKTYAEFSEGKLKWKSLDFEISPSFKLVWNKICNQVYILSGNNLYLIEYKNNKLSSNFLFKDNQLEYGNVTSIYFDKENDIFFFGSSTNGLGIYKKSNFKTISVRDANQSSVFYASQKFSDKAIITSSGFLINKDTVLKNFNFVNKEKTAMGLDKSKNLWIKSGTELYFHSKDKEFKKIKTWIFKDKIGTFLISESNKSWITLENKNRKACRLLFFEPTENPIFHNYITLNFNVNYIEESSDGKLLLATNKGLYLLDGEKNTLKLINGTAQLNIRSILRTEADEIWIATYGKGFYLHKQNILHSFPLDKNGYLATSHFFMEDKKGFFWIPTNKGLFQVKKEALLAFTKNTKQKIYYHYYNKESGFLTNEFNGGSSPFATNLGSQFFLPSINGMVTFDTEKIKPLEPKNPIYIDEILVDNKLIRTQDSLHLPNNYQRVSISFSSPYYGNQLNANFEVKLDGPNALEWSTLSSENKFTFTKLLPGTYTLTARKLSGFDSKYIYKTITIEIAPLIYQTTWFFILTIIVSGIIIYFVTKLYFNNVRRRNKILVRKIEEKTRDLQNTIGTLRITKENMKKQADKNNKLIQIISHDIKSPLKFMSMASKYMYDDFDPNSPDLKENILAIHTSSSQIYNFLDNVLSYSKVNTADGELENEYFLLSEEIQDKILFFKNIANAQKTQLINLIPNTLLLNTNKSLFAIIIHNLLDNALKHTSTGTIRFTALKNEDEITITISDEGSGMDLETLQYYQAVIENFDSNKNKSKKKLGLHLVVELMLILNGKIILESELEKGTTISLQFSNQTEKESS